MEVPIMRSHLYEFFKEFSPCQRNNANKRDVPIVGSRLQSVYCISNMKYVLLPNTKNELLTNMINLVLLKTKNRFIF